MAGRLEGKVALITGTGGGQGRAAALLFAREGAVVIGCDLKEDGARETVELVRAQGGAIESTHPLDLGESADARRWVVEAAQRHGDFDILYNNAAAPKFAGLHVVVSRAGLATSYQSAGRTGNAIKLLEATLKQQEAKLGPDHPNTLATLNGLAVAYRSAGRIDEVRFPHGPGVRVDGCVYSGAVIPPYFDSMMAKLVIAFGWSTAALLQMSLLLIIPTIGMIFFDPAQTSRVTGKD